MSKQEQLIEFAIQDIIEMICSGSGIEYDQAMAEFYKSDTFSKLCDIETELYRESSAYIYDLYLNEKKNGRLVQEEI